MTSKLHRLRISDAFIIGVLLLLALSCFLPVWHELAVSLSDKAHAEANTVGLWPIGFNIEAYKMVLEDNQFLTAFLTSVKRVAYGVVISMILIVLTAYPLSIDNGKFKGRNIFMWITVIPMIFSGGLVPLYFVISRLKLVDNFWVLVLPTAFITFNVIIMMNFFRIIPSSMAESAFMDGAGHLIILLKIYIPLSLPSVATLLLFCVVSQWNDWFFGAVFLNSAKKFPLQTYLYFLTTNIDFTRMSGDEIERVLSISGRTMRAARLFIAIIPVLLVYPLLQRYFVTGLTIGAVKE